MQRLTKIVLGAALLGVAAYLYVTPSDSPDSSQIERVAVVSALPASAREGRIALPTGAASESSSALVPAARPNLESAANIGWARLDKTTPLSTVFSASKRQSDPDERAAATHLAAKCLSITLAPPTPESIRGATGNSDRLLAEVKESVARLQSYCSEGQVDSFLQEQQSEKRSSGTLYKAMTTVRAAEKRKPDYLQAATQVLSNPEKYATQFDLWLSNNLQSSLLSNKNITDAQAAFIQDELFNRLTNAGNGSDSIRSLIRCAEQYVCAGAAKLSESEKQAASSVAATIEQQIRTQRWDLLIR